MRFDFTSPCLFAETETEKAAARVFSDALKARTGTAPDFTDEPGRASLILREAPEKTDRDAYSLSLDGNALTISAAGIRGLIFGIGHFLRKTVYKGTEITLLYDISGHYAPDKKIRGHQLGYRPCPNTYDAWDLKQYEDYYLDLMFFGANTVEHIPLEKGKSNRNELMKYDELDLLEEASAIAEKYDLDISLWYPNSEKDVKTAVKNRDYALGRAKRTDHLFVPGGDPGELDPEELFDRLDKFAPILKKYHPAAGVWPSAQAPHDRPDWGDRFIAQLENDPDYIEGIITGPNHAFDLDTLRRKTPARFPIRFYPDITHNVRCEYPVHFERDDWHYALAATQGRESPNPRPCEYRLLHRMTAPYVIGSVSYSEGVNDDVNKAVWSALDFDPDTPLTEILEDYSRLYFPGADFRKAADGIFGLEKNWEGAPDENPGIDATLALWQALGKETPELAGNWRYLLCLFRAECDAFVRKKLLFEKYLIAKAVRHIRKGELRQAENILNTPFEQDILFLRDEIGKNAERLFTLIGIQLGTEKYYAESWERGAVLDTIDQPITDRTWLLDRLKKADAMDTENAKSFMKRVVDRNKVAPDEYYYSVTLDGLTVPGIAQTPEFYMDFRGDDPFDNDGSWPVCIQKLFDHFLFRAKVGGLTSEKGYTLTVTYKDRPNLKTEHHKVAVNGVTIYEGTQFGGRKNEEFENLFLPKGFTARSYDIPDGVLEKGCAFLEISEPQSGCEIAEFRFTKRGGEQDGQ